jgi:hypothetical protein
MKTKLMLLLVMLAMCSVCWGQIGSGPRGSSISVPEHPQHASQHDMATFQSLIGGNGTSTSEAHGERPLWEFGEPNSSKKSLGDAAREYRAEKRQPGFEHATIRFEKQGKD